MHDSRGPTGEEKEEGADHCCASSRLEADLATVRRSRTCGHSPLTQFLTGNGSPWLSGSREVPVG